MIPCSPPPDQLLLNISSEAGGGRGKGKGKGKLLRLNFSNQHPTKGEKWRPSHPSLAHLRHALRHHRMRLAPSGPLASPRRPVRFLQRVSVVREALRLRRARRRVLGRAPRIGRQSAGSGENGARARYGVGGRAGGVARGGGCRAGAEAEAECEVGVLREWEKAQSAEGDFHDGVSF